MPKYSLAPVKDFRKWDEFVEKSPQRTIFSSSEYIQEVGVPYKLFDVFRGEEKNEAVSINKNLIFWCFFHDIMSRRYYLRPAKSIL